MPTKPTGTSRARSTTLTPEQRSLQGRIGAYAQAAQGKTNTAPARTAFMARFDPVDPDGLLTEAERAKLAKAAFNEHMARLSFASSKARSKRKAS